MAGPKGPAFYMAKQVQIVGEPEEQETFKDVFGHYMLSKQDLEQRIFRKNGFDDADKMFASYIDEKAWPFKAMMFDPRPYTVIIEKTARLIGSKPKGRLVPREGGDTLGAYINNELLSFQWDDNARLGDPMISKWIMMDQNARKYGSSFALCKWTYDCRFSKKKGDIKKNVFYDGPDFKICNPKDVLVNPSYSFVNKWFQHREWVTLDELEKTNDAARTLPVYKNIDLLRTSLKGDRAGRGDMRSSEYTSKNKTMRGLDDYMGRDDVFKVIELITEYRNDRWISFAPRHGVVVRDIPNPYEHGEIPVVHLKYYPLPDDIYGVSELEPVSKLVRGINSLYSQYVDNIVVDLYPPLLVNPVNVRMHTLEYAPEAKWLMNNPLTDLKRLETSTSATNNFSAVYQIMVGSLMNAWGEGSQGYSQVNPVKGAGQVTATEIKDTAFTRNVRDNMNQIFLSEALKRQVMLWHQMNQQFLFEGTTNQAKVIRVVGRDAVEFFKRNGLADIRPTPEEADQMAMGEQMPDMVEGPRYGVDMGGGDMQPKFQPDVSGEGGNLAVEQGDLQGTYDYIPDIETMKAPSDQDVEQKLAGILGIITNPAVIQMLQ